ncbi:hypothetical protein SH661x_001413 [Planctomicrobium sp. SH661]|uniref:hypothetical protein n=1 Tax=Planctomicrobium sp. SH661 TaxID=3448124 RepID=UPI003F5C5FCA
MVEEAIRSAFANPEVNLCIVPVGKLGRILWNETGEEAARLVARICPEGIFFVRRESLQTNSGTHCLTDLISGCSDRQVMILNAVETNLSSPRFPPLVPESQPIPEDVEQVLNQSGSTTEAIAYQAGLAHVLGDMDRCHELAQSIEGKGRPRHGDYWHAILHRREPDYSNAKYWFRNVGTHPVFPRLSEHASRILKRNTNPQARDWLRRLQQGSWDPMAFVDFCRDCSHDEDSDLAPAAREIQWTEMLLLLRETANTFHQSHKPKANRESERS